MALKWSGLGMNVGGYGTIDATWPTTVSKYYRDLDEIKSAGFTHVRVGNGDWQFGNAYPLSKAITEYAISIGLNTMWGPDQSATMTSSNYADYHTAVLAALDYAMGIGLQRFSLGNEMEATNDNTTLTDSQLFDELITTAEACQAAKAAASSSIEITYNSTAGATIVDLWNSKSLSFGSSFDYICFQPYGNGQTDLSGFKTDCDRIWGYFGTNSKLTEFNLVTDAGTLNISQRRQEQEMGKRIGIIRSIGFEEAYFFTWKKSDNNEKLGTKYITDGDGYKQWYWSLISGRRNFEHYLT